MAPLINVPYKLLICTFTFAVLLTHIFYA